MKESIDNYFKDRLEERTVAFQSDHWNGVERLLEEDKKQKRILFFWCFGGLFLGMLLGVIVMNTYLGFYSFKAQEEVTTTNKDQIIPLNKNLTEEKSKITSSFNNNHSKEEYKETINKPKKNKVDQDKVILPSKVFNHSKSLTINTKNTATESQKEALIQDLVSAASREITSLDIAKEETPNASLINSHSFTNSLVETIRSSKEDIDLLTIPSIAPPVFPTWSATTAIIAASKKKWECGITLGGNRHLNKTNSQEIGGLNASTKGWDFRGGVYTGYPLSEHLLLNVELVYFFRKGGIVNEQFSEITKFDFGFQKTQFSLQTKYLQYLSLPITLQYNIRPRLKVEGGVSINYLLSVKANYQEQVSGTSQLMGAASRQSNIWVSKQADFNNWAFSGILGFNQQINTKWKLGFRAHYNFSSFLKLREKNALIIENQVISNFYLGLYLKYNIRIK